MYRFDRVDLSRLPGIITISKPGAHTRTGKMFVLCVVVVVVFVPRFFFSRSSQLFVIDILSSSTVKIMFISMAMLWWSIERQILLVQSKSPALEGI